MKYETLFRRMPALATVQDTEGRFVDVSNRFAERLGHTRESLIGHRLLDFVPDDCARRIEREYRPSLRRTGEILNVPVEFMTAAGEPARFLASTRLEKTDGANSHSFSVYRDADDVEQISQRFQELYRATPAMLHTIDSSGRLLEVSDRWLAKLGYRRDEVLGRDITTFLTALTNEELSAGRIPRLSTVAEHTNHLREMTARDGSVIQVLMSAIAERDKDGKITRLLVASKDITEMNRAQQQLQHALEENTRLRQELQAERDYLREEIDVSMNFGRIVGSSPALRAMLAQIAAVASTPANVLITGESGTGKELVAYAIHGASERADKPLVKVNCASIPGELFESEFFGHVKGAFTGAIKDRVGRFQLANGGTLFLDEVGEIPLELQGKLLRVLQEQEFEAVGDDRTRKVDVRVIAATNRDLTAEVAAGRFREDLYYRLSVFPVEVPPLRKRGDDVVQLATHFIEHIAREFGREIPVLTDAQIAALKHYDWPGNVRELKNALERAMILSRGSVLELDPATAHTVPEEEQQGPRRLFMTEAEIRALHRDNTIAALEASGWRVAGADGAAALLGLRPSTLSDRMKSLGIERPRLKKPA